MANKNVETWEDLSETQKQNLKQIFLDKLHYKDESVLIQTMVQWLQKEEKTIDQIFQHFKSIYDDNLFHEYIDHLLEDIVLKLYEDEEADKGQNK